MSVNASLRELKEDITKVKEDMADMRFMLKKLVPSEDPRDAQQNGSDTTCTARDMSSV
jgi:hypothetical protein